MLLPLKTNWITNGPFYHLGDIVNIVQQVHARSLDVPGYYRMGALSNCPCCGGNTGKMMKEIISLLDTQIVFSKLTAECVEEYTPAWVLDHKPNPWDRLPYFKARNLPVRGSHVVCQFDGRSQGDKIPSKEKIFKLIRPKMINVGDKDWPCCNSTGMGLIEKFNMIASAKEYVGVDSGLTHLALMTNTPVTLVHPRNWNARKYYPETDQLQFRIL